MACQQQKQVDLIVHNATIYSIDGGMNVYEAIAIDSGRIVEIGAEHQILNKYSAEKKVDVSGGYIYPGIIDAHCHFLGYGIESNRLDVTHTQSLEDFLSAVDSFARRSTLEWIIGRGWDHNKWLTKNYPHWRDLEEVLPGKHIAIKRVDGHAWLVSKSVLELAGVTADSQIDGGEILLVDGEPSGVLIDNAMTLVNSVIPNVTRGDKVKALLAAQDACIKNGLTMVTDAGLSVEDVRIIDSLHQQGILKIRVSAMYTASETLKQKLSAVAVETDRLRAKAIKLYADGALGSRGALLLEPYADQPGHFGLQLISPDELSSWAELCYEHGFQMNVHCIGDSANRMVLHTMANTLKGINDRRWRIEHAQVVHPKDRAMFGAFNIIPSVQPTHAISDMGWVENRLGPHRIGHAYSYKSLMDQNGLIALGTDFPVEQINPFETFRTAVERTDKNGEPKGGFIPGEKLSRENAIRGMTIFAAVSSFMEDKCGSLEPGKCADFVVLDTDIMKCPAANLLQVKVLQTWIDGEMVFGK
ncbi:MAG: amidohydrolase [Salibacteraceae bacterium]